MPVRDGRLRAYGECLQRLDPHALAHRRGTLCSILVRRLVPLGDVIAFRIHAIHFPGCSTSVVENTPDLFQKEL